MSKYQITLTPVDKFFFGGDMTFQVGNDKKDKFNAQFSSYIIESTHFPQQTSLLGMLRFLILRNAGDEVFKDNKIVDGGEPEKLIGKKSFTVNMPQVDKNNLYKFFPVFRNLRKTSHAQNEFGAIKSISHVRIRRGDKELEYAPLFGKIDFNGSSKGSYNFGKIQIPNLSEEQYKAKDGLETLLIEKTEIDQYFEDYQAISKKRKEEKKKKEPKLTTPPYQLDDDIFIKDRRVGISRNIDTGKTDDGALFKQISYRFNDKGAKHCFVFYAEVEGIDLTNYKDQLVSVGGDNSQFIIGIEKMENDESTQEDEKPKTALALSLLSPAFLTRKDVKDNTRFAITQLMPFRFLTDRKVHSKQEKREQNERSYHILNSKLERSPRYELYAPGSVFYFKDEDQMKKFITALENKHEFRQIGYNEYQLINEINNK